MNRLQKNLARLATDLENLGARWALVGALALVARAYVRNTVDVDVVVSVRGDAEAEALVSKLFDLGYQQHQVLERKSKTQLRGVRLLAPQNGGAEGVVDLLFAVCGTEPEIVDSAELMEVLPGVSIPVASRGHLLAMKILAWRDQDLMDARFLLRDAEGSEILDAEEALRLISQRGFAEAGALEARLQYLKESAPRAGD